MRPSAISVTGSTAVTSLTAPLVDVVSVMLVSAVVGWLGGSDVTPQGILPAKAEMASASVKAAVAKESFNRFMVSPEKSYLLVPSVRPKTKRGRIIGIVDTKSLKTCGIFRKYAER
jgi:hypothetical protein